MRINWVSFITGFLLLFAVYHFPEFFNAFWITAVCKIGFLAVAFGIARYQGFTGLGGYGLNMHPGWSGNLVKGLLTGLFFFGLSVFISVLLGYERFQSVEILSVFARQLPVILLMTVFPSVAEDILTRGYLYGHLKGVVSENFFVIVSATVFVLNHIWRLADDPSVHSYLFLMGMATAFALWRSGSLWMA
ncbi:MAG TPA: CPBP family intramembrane metalloprotease, partial [Ferruginibacter sp.]|nr:CPBP family intramembrane metalloprotease [Ferruginibacter sp.]